MQVKVNSEKCIGCGNCVALTEGQIFDFNDEGLAETIVDTIPEESEEVVKEAICECPTDAIEENKNEGAEEIVKEAICECPTDAIKENKNDN